MDAQFLAITLDETMDVTNSKSRNSYVMWIKKLKLNRGYNDYSDGLLAQIKLQYSQAVSIHC